MTNHLHQSNGEPGHPNPSTGNRGEISLYDGFYRVLKGWRILLLWLGGALLAGVIIIAGSRAEYVSTTSLRPEQERETLVGGLGLLAQFGGFLGGFTNVIGADNTSSFPIGLYPHVLGSTPMRDTLLREKIYVPSHDTTVTLAYYLSDLKPNSLFDLPGKLLSRGRSKGEAIPSRQDLSRISALDSTAVWFHPYWVQLMEDLKDRIEVDFDIKTGALDIEVTMPDPQIAAQVASLAMQNLTQYVTQYRVQKLTSDLTFIEQRYAEAEQRFDAAAQTLAQFRDTNKHLVRDVARTQEERLQAEYELAFNLYNSLSSRLEEARISLQEKTPVFQVMEPIRVPLQKSYPPTVLTLLLSGIFGLMVGGGYLFFRPELQKLNPRRRHRHHASVPSPTL